MCTCLRIKGNDTFFGRNMDITHSFNECVIITPKNYNLTFKLINNITSHYAIIGIGTIINNYPLYAEAINEYGLGITGLNFPDNCYYYNRHDNKINITPYELILYILGKFKSVKEVKKIINNLNITNIDFSDDIKLTPLHFMISDKEESIIIETLKEGMKVYDNPFDVFTNNPPFDYHKENIRNYLNLTNKDPINAINKTLKLTPYSFGQGAIGLPGDTSSSSRFIRAFFNKSFLLFNDDEVNQFFKCLDSVSMIKGVVLTEQGYEYTRYTSCYNLDKGILYYKTYYESNIKSIKLNEYNLDDINLISIKM